MNTNNALDALVSESICQAVDTIVSQRLQEVSFDTTVVCTITDIVDAQKGEYIVKNENGRFTAYASSPSTQYYQGASVYVTIPRGDYSARKIIVAKYSDIDDLSGNYVYPMDNIDWPQGSFQKLSANYNLISKEPYDGLDSISTTAEKITIERNESFQKNITLKLSKENSSLQQAYLSESIFYAGEYPASIIEKEPFQALDTYIYNDDGIRELVSPIFEKPSDNQKIVRYSYFQSPALTNKLLLMGISSQFKIKGLENYNKQQKGHYGIRINFYKYDTDQGKSYMTNLITLDVDNSFYNNYLYSIEFDSQEFFGNPYLQQGMIQQKIFYMPIELGSFPIVFNVELYATDFKLEDEEVVEIEASKIKIFFDGQTKKTDKDNNEVGLTGWYKILQYGTEASKNAYIYTLMSNGSVIKMERNQANGDPPSWTKEYPELNMSTEEEEKE